MKNIYSQLEWLPKVPTSFSQEAKALDQAENPGAVARRLANTRLDLDQLFLLAKRVARLTKPLGSEFIPIHLGIVSNATVSLFPPAFAATGIRHGLNLKITEAEFGAVTQQVLDKNSKIYESKCDAVLLALDHRGLPLAPALGLIPKSAEAQVEAVMAYYESLVSASKKNGIPTVILQTIPRPTESLFGPSDARIPGTLHWLIERINQEIFRKFPSELVLDIAALAETVGLSEWHNPSQWHLAKLSFSPDLIPLYADYVVRSLASLRGKSKKCLVLDLDNTLWGGIIGDDGVDGIQIGNGHEVGEAHLGIQKWALDLRARGILLAVASKNEESVAKSAFEKHPDMILRLNHFSAFQANWTDKAANLRAIAEKLNIGVDSLVFLDDNPVEREQVRFELPSVSVPEVPNDSALFVRYLAAGGYFDSVFFSEEDLSRAAFYEQDAKRTELVKQSVNYESYLSSLEMELHASPFNSNGRARIAQLIQRSNQFNLTTKRYSESEIETFESDKSYFTLQVRLTDRFGDNGMISVIICKKSPEAWSIDTWLMSCRVLERKVETAVLEILVKNAKEAGAKKLVGEFIPTAKNALVKDHYKKLGFQLVESSDEGKTSWELDVGSVTLASHQIKVILG